MELAALQRQLLGLIKLSHQVSEDDDPYIRAVAESKHLEMVQEIIIWWRAYGLERYCVLTSTLLKRLDIFEDAVRFFIATRKLSPFIQKLGPSFLEAMADHDNPLVVSVAQFEHALIKVKLGEIEERTIDWPYEPNGVVKALLEGLPLVLETAAGCYRTVVSRRLPDLYYVEHVLA
jgi:hypothetical protein